MPIQMVGLVFKESSVEDFDGEDKPDWPKSECFARMFGGTADGFWLPSGLVGLDGSMVKSGYVSHAPISKKEDCVGGF